MKCLRRAQQRLGRDTSPVVADAAEIGLLDDSGLEAKLRRADRGDVAAGARADDDDVEGGVGHVTCSFSSWRRSTVHSRHCEEQSTFVAEEMDCFAALAMTDATSASYH